MNKKAEKELIRRAMKLLGESRSEKKTLAARENAKRPPRPGSRPRGRPKKDTI